MASLVLRAEPRVALGKKNKALRREGKIPAVIYGPAVEGTIQVQLDLRTFDKFYPSVGQSIPFTVEWEGGSQNVIIREVQMDNIKRVAIHVDLYAGN